MADKSKIHPTAVIAPSVKIGEGTEIGPYTIIEEDVIIGRNNVIAASVFIGKHTRIGDNNKIHYGAVIGNIPQDISFGENTVSYLKIGNSNIIREGAVLHRSARENGVTVLGDENYLMHHSHLGHDVRLGNQVILGPNALLAGYVQVGDRGFISGNTAIHQFCRVGRLGLLRGVSAVSMDIPPFCIADWHNTLRGLNVIGLRRAGISSENRQLLKEAFRYLFRSGLALQEAVANLEKTNTSPIVEELLEFIRTTKRGIVTWRHVEDDTDPETGSA